MKETITTGKEDKDLVHFAGALREDGSVISGITCREYTAGKAEGPVVYVGSRFCLRCPACYGSKIRVWAMKDSKVTEYDGYVSCAASNMSAISKIKRWWWHKVRRERPDITALGE